jgi:hypothetical protein
MEAVVVDFNPRHPFRPKVQGIRAPNGEPIKNPAMEEIDLALYTDEEIASINGLDVRQFAAGLVEEREPALIG